MHSLPSKALFENILVQYALRPFSSAHLSPAMHFPLEIIMSQSQSQFFENNGRLESELNKSVLRLLDRPNSIAKVHNKLNESGN